jgi:hypothetical protein
MLQELVKDVAFVHGMKNMKLIISVLAGVTLEKLRVTVCDVVIIINAICSSNCLPRKRSFDACLTRRRWSAVPPQYLHWMQVRGVNM